MELIILAAVDEDGGIGKGGTMPWHEPEDLKNFARRTMFHHVVMGYNTWLSLDGKPLHHRTNLVLTSMPRRSGDANVMHSLDDLFEYYKSSKLACLYVIGGAKVYEQLLPMVSTMYITRIKGDYDCDTHFPEIDLSEWDIINETKLSETATEFTYVRIEKCQPTK